MLVASKDEAEHLSHLRLIFSRLREFGITVNSSKCTLGAHQLEFLGHSIDQDGIKPLPSKVDAITKYPEPNSLSGIRRFLGVVNFYRRFIPKCAHLAQPLTDLLRGSRKDGPVELNTLAKEAFNSLKTVLSNVTMLSHPAPNAPLCLTVDASNVAIGAVLQQFQDEAWQPLAFFSKRLQPAETKYSTFGRELLGMYLSVKHFRYFLGCNFFLSRLIINL